MKICTTCKENKELTDFSKDKSRKDGLQINCKKCNFEYASKHKKQKAITAKIWYEKNKEELAIYRAAHKEEKLTYNIIYREKKKEEIAAQRAIYRSTRKEKVMFYNSDYAQNHPDIMAAKSARRRASKMQATPLWLTKEQNKENRKFYSLAKELQWLSEELLVVDHIIPLQGKNVSGLHVPWNLQILTESANSAKNNKLLKEELEAHKLFVMKIINKP